MFSCVVFGYDGLKFKNLAKLKQQFCSMGCLFALSIVFLTLMGVATTSSSPRIFTRLSRLKAAGKSDSGDGDANSNTPMGSSNSLDDPKQKEREQLYEAYNLLHTLAQDFHKPFDAPAVIVIGHQTSGKSALIEALMGFQFNQVGGGTKTRRPVALRMQYNPACTVPTCFLTLDNGKEEQRTLEDIQAYIEAENKRLEKDPSRSFDSREINIRMEYKYCPNMIVIDTPGMIHPPKGRQLTPQQRALAQASREAESLVLSKIRCPDYIILCVEDTTDWKHATTRNVVMQADPELSRTVMVTTKLDTKLPQFSDAEDLNDFLSAPIVKKMFPRLMGGPFFTSVPSGRVGISKDFTSNEAFVRCLRGAEQEDRVTIIDRMGSQKSAIALNHVGVSRLRMFLESRVEDCYRKNVAKIIPLLQAEHRFAQSKLNAVSEELSALSVDRLRSGANAYRERFAKELSHCIQGSVKASPEVWGETLEAEQLRGGSFVDSELTQYGGWQMLVDHQVGNAGHKLFGGAQYHRALREFVLAVKHMKIPGVTEDEIANAAGVGDTHDGVNFMRAACVIAIEKAQLSFEPMLEALRARTVHVMRRLYPIVEHMLNKLPPAPTGATTSASLRGGGSVASASDSQGPLQEWIKKIFHQFVDAQISLCLDKCRDDLQGMTRFVTWDSDGKGGSSSIYKSLPTPKLLAHIYTLNTETAKSEKKSDKGKIESRKYDVEADVVEAWTIANTDPQPAREKTINTGRSELGPALEATLSSPTSGTVALRSDEDMKLEEHFELLQLMEEMLAGRNANRTSIVVSSIVQYIIRSWTEHFARTVAMKFNCFFLLPFIDDFPVYLRDQLDRIYDSGMDEMFDVQEVRRALQLRKDELSAECEANLRLQQRFDQINSQLRSTPPSVGVKDNTGFATPKLSGGSSFPLSSRPSWLRDKKQKRVKKKEAKEDRSDDEREE